MFVTLNNPRKCNYEIIWDHLIRNQFSYRIAAQRGFSLLFFQCLSLHKNALSDVKIKEGNERQIQKIKNRKKIERKKRKSERNVQKIKENKQPKSRLQRSKSYIFSLTLKMEETEELQRTSSVSRHKSYLDAGHYPGCHLLTFLIFCPRKSLSVWGQGKVTANARESSVSLPDRRTTVPQPDAECRCSESSEGCGNSKVERSFHQRNKQNFIT